MGPFFTSAGSALAQRISIGGVEVRVWTARDDRPRARAGASSRCVFNWHVAIPRIVAQKQFFPGRPIIGLVGLRNQTLAGISAAGFLGKANSSLVTNIGDLLRKQVEMVEGIQQLQNKATSQGGNIEVVIEKGEKRCRIKNHVWEASLSFDSFVEYLVQCLS